MLKYIFIVLTLILSSCSTFKDITTNSSEPKRTPAREGFYEVPSSLSKTALSVGLFFAEMTVSIPEDLVAATRADECGTPEGRLWRGDMCKRIWDKACDKGCTITSYFPRCSGGRIGPRFVTARHCFPEELPNLQVRFMAADGSILTIPMKSNETTYHKLPYDIATISPIDQRNFDKIPSLKIAASMRDGDAVVGIGFPNVDERFRTVKGTDYTFPKGGMRMTVGKISNANLNKQSYCAYTNYNEMGEPERWVLKDSCAHLDYSKIDPEYARIEHNPMLTDTDMVWGMSGSLLFSTEGTVLGIGSTVKTSEPGNYSINAPAIYSKAENLNIILRTLQTKE